jgi:sugar/nucleoside kinase (ribokinase family)
VVSPGAAHTIAGTAVNDAVPQGGVLWLDGLLIDALPWLEDLARLAHAKGSLVAMDVSTLGNVIENADRLKKFAQEYADFVFANEAEFSVLFPFGPRGIPVNRKTPRVVASPKSLTTINPGHTCWVVKQGQNGAFCAYRDNDHNEIQIVSAPTKPLAPGDSTGAGDFFAAGFLHGAIGGHSFSDCLLSDCLKEGNTIAGEILLEQNSHRSI